MILSMLACTTFALSMHHTRYAPDVTHIFELRPVTQRDCDLQNTPFSIAGIVYKGGIRCYNNVGFMVFAIPEGSKSLDCYVGQDDNRNPPQNLKPTYAIYLDGDKVESGSRAGIAKPTHISLNVENARSVKFEVGATEAIGDPVFSTDSASGGSANSSDSTTKALKLLLPVNKATVSGAFVELSWEAVDGATSYLVETTAREFDADVAPAAPKIFCTTAVHTSIRLKTDQLPPGRYSWTVLAYGSRKPIGEFSDERIFVLKK